MTAAIRKPRMRGIPRHVPDDTEDAPSAGAPADSGRLQFVHLKVHSAYSLLEGALPIPKLASCAAACNMPALALTDSNNLFGALEFSNKLAAAGIQPIIGVSIAIDMEDRSSEDADCGGNAGPNARTHRDAMIALLAMNRSGYANLMKLVSSAYLDTADADDPHIKLTALKAQADGLICMTGGPDGPIDSAIAGGRTKVAESRLEVLQKIFADKLYVEIQRHGLTREQEVEPVLIDLAYAAEIPLVATNEACFATPDDHEAHDALLCIADGRYVSEDDRRRASPEHFFKSQRQMAEVFADLPEALENTIEIAKRCAFRPLGAKPILPNFLCAKTGDDASQLSAEQISAEQISTEQRAAEQLASESNELANQARAGLATRLEAHGVADGFSEKMYADRLDFELGVISDMKFPGYFLIVADFIKWAKAQAIPVGPGRGSGAGSLVAWALTITDLDPMRFGLLFERFLNPERVSMPDFDIDFCQERRDEVIRYVQDKYGHDRVAQIITHGKLQARAVLRDVGRVLQMPYGQVDRICKLVPNNPASPMSLKEAIETEPGLEEEREKDELVGRLYEIAQKLEGLYRHASTHAAGIVIGDRPLNELVPLYRDPKSTTPVTQFNWKMVEAAGLVKFDFLGLKTLTVLQKAVDFVKRRGIDLDLAALPLDDKASFDLLAKADTAGVFQLESTGMRESLRKLRPDRFEDIIAMVALYRPGPMDNIPTYINRKHGEEPINCLHPMLEQILTETHGVIIYQEQVIKIAQVMGGYTLGQADILRRAMGKKDKAEMAAQKARFVEGAVAKDVAKADAEYIFELVDKFAGYGFNKSHAAAYALVAYHTAYMKANYPVEFLAASMSLDIGNTDKLAMFAAEVARSQIALLPPCVNSSTVDFEPENGGIRYSLAALKNIGEQAVASLAGERTAGGVFKDLSEFARRLGPKTLNKRGLETLAAAGAFDELEPNRALVHGNAANILGLAGRIQADEAAGTSDLFGGTEPLALDLREALNWTPMERLSNEFDAVGFFLSGHPLDEYDALLKKLDVMRFAAFEEATKTGLSAGRLAGIVVSARVRKSAKGNSFAFAQFSDATGSFEAVVFSDVLDASRDLLVAGTAVVIAVEADRDGDTLKLRAGSIRALDEAAGGLTAGLKIVLDGKLAARKTDALKGLGAVLSPATAGKGSGGEFRLVMDLDDKRLRIEFTLPGRFDVSPTVRGKLQIMPGVLAVEDV